jgi:hypothetical protein
MTDLLKIVTFSRRTICAHTDYFSAALRARTKR